jgi:histidinol dehydrogenase
MGAKWTAIEAVGLYVPGGTAAYPSSVLMNAVPAKVAGVSRLAMVVPAPDGKLNPLVLAAARLAGVDEIYRIGGAQAVAALAYGPTALRRCQDRRAWKCLCCGAKRLVFGKVGIDMVAGPSEVLILADKTANADWIAADLLAQAEHDASAQSILITDDAGLADRVEKAVQSQLKTLPRAKVAGASWSEFGAVIVVRKLDDAIALVDQLAPEHLEILADDPERLVKRNPQCGRDLHWGAHAGGDRRLRCGFQPCAADRALGEIFVGPGRARFHEAHLVAQVRAGAIARARTGGDRARRGGGLERPRPLGVDTPQPEMSAAKSAPAGAKRRLAAVVLDEESIGRSNPDVEHERQVAIYDLLEQNSFAPVGHESGPYTLHLSINGNRLVFDIRQEDGTPVVAHLFSLTPLRRIVKDYYMICDSYYQAIRTATPDKIEAIDMGRRAIHNDGSRILVERLKGKVTVDIDTARRLFTLICVLHWKG